MAHSPLSKRKILFPSFQSRNKGFVSNLTTHFLKCSFPSFSTYCTLISVLLSPLTGSSDSVMQTFRGTIFCFLRPSVECFYLLCELPSSHEKNLLNYLSLPTVIQDNLPTCFHQGRKQLLSVSHTSQ